MWRRHKKKRIHAESKKRDYIKMYIPHVAEALQELIGDSVDQEKVKELLSSILEEERGELQSVKVVNDEYDEELAKIGKEPKESQTTLGETEEEQKAPEAEEK